MPIEKQHRYQKHVWHNNILAQLSKPPYVGELLDMLGDAKVLN